MITVIINIVAFCFTVYMLFYAVNFISCFRVVVQSLWVINLVLRLVNIGLVRTGLDPSSYAIRIGVSFNVIYGIATLATALYSAAFLLYFFRPSLLSSIAIVGGIISVHIALGGSMYMGVAINLNVHVDFEQINVYFAWRKCWGIWIIFMFIWDLIPIFMVIFSLLKSKSNSLYDIARNIHAADSLIFPVALIDVVCILFFSFLGLLLDFTTTAGGDVAANAWTHITCLPESVHVLATLYLMWSIKNIVAFAVSQSQSRSIGIASFKSKGSSSNSFKSDSESLDMKNTAAVSTAATPSLPDPTANFDYPDYFIRESAAFCREAAQSSDLTSKSELVAKQEPEIGDFWKLEDQTVRSSHFSISAYVDEVYSNQ